MSDIEYQRIWREKNKDRVRGYTYKWREKNKEKQNAIYRKYYQTHKLDRIAGSKRRYRNKRNKCMALVGASCRICGVSEGRRLVFHHIWYTDNKKIYKHSEQILNEVLKKPEQFALVCQFCHGRITYFMRNRMEFKRLIQLVEESRDFD